MNAIELTTATIARLKTYLPGFDIREFPDRPDDFILTHPKAALLVMYAGSDGDERRRECTLDVTAISRGLNTALQCSEAIRMILTSWIPAPGYTRLTCTKDSFMMERSGEWQYGISFTTAGPAAPTAEADLAAKITALNL